MESVFRNNIVCRTRTTTLPVGGTKYGIPHDAIEPLLDKYLEFWFGRGRDEVNSKGQTPLMQASIQGDEASVFMLVKFATTEYSLDIIGDVDQSGWTPLHHAAQNGFVSIVQLFLERENSCQWWNDESDDSDSASCSNLRRTIHSQSNYGRTPLHCAAWRNENQSVVELLLANGAEVNAQDIDGQTALMEAIKYGQETIAQLLLDHGANPRFKDRLGHTPLFMAVDLGQRVMVRLLLETTTVNNDNDHEDLVNIKETTHGHTPLHVAASHGYESIVQLLCDKGADRHLADKYGTTAVQMATARGHRSIAYLLSHPTKRVAKQCPRSHNNCNKVAGAPRA
jgi:ankyrin repeat protein